MLLFLEKHFLFLPNLITQNYVSKSRPNNFKTMNTEEVKNSIEDIKQELLNHSLYKNVTSIDELHVFLEYHIFDFLENVEKTKNIFVSIKASKLPAEVKAFLNYTFTIVEEGEPHKIASAFTFGREDLIPNMFTEILRNCQVNFPDVNLSKLIYYFERHIELDADEHGPMAMKMIDELCGDCPKKWTEVKQVAHDSLQMRIQLWNAIDNVITRQLV